MSDPTEFLRLALDPIRLAVLGAAAVGPVDVAALADRLDVSALRAVSSQLPEMAPADESVLEGTWSSEERVIVARLADGAYWRSGGRFDIQP
jgi:hypothetical protein